MAEWIQAIAAVIGTVIAGLGFYYVVQQLIQNRDATKNQTRWAIAQVSCDVYRVFVDKPELALELFANESAPQRSGPGAAETTARLDAAAEMIFDYFEAIVESAGAVDQHTHNAWRLYMRQTLQASALLRSFFDREKHRFTPNLREELAGTVDELREQMDRDHGPSR